MSTRTVEIVEGELKTAVATIAERDTTIAGHKTTVDAMTTAATESATKLTAAELVASTATKTLTDLETDTEKRTIEVSGLKTTVAEHQGKVTTLTTERDALLEAAKVTGSTDEQVKQWQEKFTSLETEILTASKARLVATGAFTEELLKDKTRAELSVIESTVARIAVAKLPAETLKGLGLGNGTGAGTGVGANPNGLEHEVNFIDAYKKKHGQS